MMINNLGPSLERFVVIADGSFWFETEDMRQALDHLEKLPRQGSRGAVWMRCERGSMLIHRIGERRVKRVA